SMAATSSWLARIGCRSVRRLMAEQIDQVVALVVTVNPLATVHRDLITGFAARYKVPAIYPLRYFALSGGLLSYGPDRLEPYRRAASYVDRILKGETPADLPVQEPTKYELIVNLKSARSLGRTIPPSLLLRADQVID